MVSFDNFLSMSNPYLSAVAVVVIGFFASQIARALVRRARKLALKTKTNLDDEILDAIEVPVYRALLVLSVFFALGFLPVDENGMKWISFVSNVLLSLVYVIVISALGRLSTIFMDYFVADIVKKTDTSLDDQLLPIVKKIISVSVWILGIMWILELWGINTAPLLAGVGVAGLAVSLAMQQTLSNIIAGISLTLDKTYKVGDKVQLSNGQVGVIHDITLRSTKIRTYDNEIVIVPNSVLANDIVKNFAQPELRSRVVVPFSVSYGSDPDKVKEIVLPLLLEDQELLKDPSPSVDFTEMKDYCLSFVAKAWVEKYGDAYRKKLELTDRIYRTLMENGIEIPFPTTTVLFKDLSSGQRSRENAQKTSKRTSRNQTKKTPPSKKKRKK